MGVTLKKRAEMRVSREGKVVERRDHDWRVQRGRIMADGWRFGVGGRFGWGVIEV